MALTLHNLVFVIDVDCGAAASARRLHARNHWVKRGMLQILLHAGYTYGFDKVRWGYTFFQSTTGRGVGRVSRVSDFKELRHKTFEDFEVELDAKFDVTDKVRPSVQKVSSQSAALQNALKETLLDFQWDRPDITSPTKLSLRPRKSNRAGTASVSQVEECGSGGGRNLVFVVSECPHSRAQLGDYLSSRCQDLTADVTEHIMSRGLRDMLVQRQVVLNWIDSRSYVQISECEDYVGSDKVSEVLALVGGRVIPMSALLNLCYDQNPDSGFRGEFFALKSSIGYLLSSDNVYRLAFPVIEGILRWGQGGLTLSCKVVVEPLSCRQRILPDLVEVCLKGVVQEWDTSSLTRTYTESWVLQCPSTSDEGAVAFRRLLMELTAHGVHMLAEVNDSSLMCSAVLSPMSHSTALLTVLQPGITQPNQLLAPETIAPAVAEPSAELPEVVSSVLGVVYDIMEKDDDVVDDKLKDHEVPEWAQQELSRCPLTAGVLENWFPHSDQSGVSSHLMESIKLLHAVPEKEEEEEMSVQQELISGLAELYQTSQGADSKRGKKRGTQRTPVKQKMKTMSRSLQMLNVARLNVKAQKSQAETEQTGSEGRGTDRTGKRRSSDRNTTEAANTIRFTSEAELLAHLKSSYEKTVAERDSCLLSSVQQLMSAVKTFLVSKSDPEVKTSQLVQQHLLKTSKSIRQLYGPTTDVDSKVRECQLQAVLRLELCRRFSSEHSDSLDCDQMAEEVAEMLRIISLTKDPVCLARFLQDEVLPVFLTAVPRVLADIYHSLGTQLPEALLAVLPADFFSDESVAKDSVSPCASSPPLSTLSHTSGGKDCLQDLRNRSATKRRMMTRHRSMTESSQGLRQVEIPKKATRASKSKACLALEKPVAEPQAQKQETQEVTKVRRNLFNQEIGSPSKKGKLPRSRSVSAVEGLKRKRSPESEEGHKLLTKQVCETPQHKQVSSRLLYRQKIGRKSDQTEGCIVEESPVKPAEDLRRSPRIKKFARRHSNTFYSSSQPRSRNLDRALSASQLNLSDSRAVGVDVRTVRSPMRLLFGAANSPRTTRSRLCTDSSVFESPNKTPTKSPNKCGQASLGSTTPKTPRTPGRTPPSSRTRVSSVAESPVAGSSRELGMELRGSPFRSPARKTLVVETPTKQSPVRSPLKGILRTPVKALAESSASSGLQLPKSPVSKTPKKSVTWSPSPHKCRVLGNGTAFKVPESPRNASRSSPRSMKTSNTFTSPVKSQYPKRDIFKTPEKICQVSLERISENVNRVVLARERNVQSAGVLDAMKTPEKCDAAGPSDSPPLHATLPPDQLLSPKRRTATKAKTPSPTCQMITRSGRTPAMTPSDKERKSPTKKLSGQAATSTRRSTRSQASEDIPLVLNRDSHQNSGLEQSDDKDIQSELDCSSQTDSQLSSQFNSASTEDDSLDIVDAAVVRTQFSGGLKMNISFSRKPSKSNQSFQLNTDSPKQHVRPQGRPGRSYGFRQTPDRQQREAAARLGYGNNSPRFSTPRGLARPGQQKGPNLPDPLTYQVEMEMQNSGLPKLKIKRSDSVSAGDLASDGGPRSGAQSPLGGVKPSNLESPLALLSKPRDAGCVSPSGCAHVTPAKSTPGKGGSIQTHICQSYTPTHCAGGSVSPEVIPLTPSPQSAGKVTPDNLNSWPRRKRAQAGVAGGKDRGLKGEPQLEELMEEADLGVSLLQDVEDTEEPSDYRASTQSPPARAGASPLCPLEDLDWMETLAQQGDRNDPQRTAESGESQSVSTPPSSKVRRSVTASGILALTHSPLLFKGKTGSASKKTPEFKDVVVEAASGRRRQTEGGDPSPLSQPIRRSDKGRTHSRKRLLH